VGPLLIFSISLLKINTSETGEGLLLLAVKTEVKKWGLKEYK
jgi:hypothetical protein